MRIKSKENTIAGLVFLFLGIIIYATIPSQIEEANFTELGARFFPQFLSILLMIMSGLLFLSGLLRSNDNDESTQRKKASILDELRAVGTVVFIIINIALMPLIGFAASSILSLGGIMVMLKVRTWWYYVVLVAVVIIVQFFFVNVMYVQLP